jgi:hypothetical protein
MDELLTGQGTEPFAIRWTQVLRVLFVSTVLYGGLLFWLAPRLPMCDLPQHAAQVALLRDLIDGVSPWRDLVRINYFTPYLTGYGLSLALSYFMPVNAALKVVLTAAYYAFVISCVMLRRRFGGDERLDWLFIPGFFGFAFAWGFFPFLVATPIGLMFILMAHRYAVMPSVRGAIIVVTGGVITFFSHGMVFLFSCLIGFGFLAIRKKTISRLAYESIPFVILGILAVVYAVTTRESDPLFSHSSYLPRISWGGWVSLRQRPIIFSLYVWTSEDFWASGDSIYRNLLFVFFGFLMFAAPWLLRNRINWQRPSSLVPLVVVGLICLVGPSEVTKTYFFFQRFAVFLLPAYGLAFCKMNPPTSTTNNSGLQTVYRSKMTILALASMMLSCWAFFAVQTVRISRFSEESKPFERIMNLAEPGQRALLLIFDRNSHAFNTSTTYGNYPAWYQAERRGFVDVNFALFLPEIVRFRLDRFPAASPFSDPGWHDSLRKFDWESYNGKIYRYFFVRNSLPLPSNYFENRECQVNLVEKDAEWSLYERGKCR